MNPWEQKQSQVCYRLPHSRRWIVERRLPSRGLRAIPTGLRRCQVESEDSPHQRGGEHHSGKFIFPFAILRQKRLLLDADFGVPADLPNLVDTSDDDAPRGAGSSSDGLVPPQEGPFPPKPLFRHLHPQRLYSHRRTRRLCLEPTHEGWGWRRSPAEATAEQSG